MIVEWKQSTVYFLQKLNAQHHEHGLGSAWPQHGLQRYGWLMAGGYRNGVALNDVGMVLALPEIGFNGCCCQAKVCGASRHVEHINRIKAWYVDDSVAWRAVYCSLEVEVWRTEQWACAAHFKAVQQAQVAIGHATLAPGVFGIGLQHVYESSREVADEPAIGAVSQQGF